MGIVLSSITSFCAYLFGWINPSGTGFDPSSVAGSTANAADITELTNIEIMKNSPDSYMSYMYQFFPEQSDAVARSRDGLKQRQEAAAAAIQACKDVCNSAKVKKYENQQQYQMRLFGIIDSKSRCEDTEKPHCACQMKNQIENNEYDLYPYNPDGEWYLTIASAVTRWQPSETVLAVDGLWNSQIKDNSDDASKSAFPGNNFNGAIHRCRLICQKARRFKHHHNSVRLHALKNGHCECQVFHNDCHNNGQHFPIYPHRHDAKFCKGHNNAKCV